MVLGTNKNNSLDLNIAKNKIKRSTEVTILGIKIYKNLKSHIKELCKKPCFKQDALRRIRKYLTVEKAKLLANTFINNQFSNASLIGMFAGKSFIAKICKIHFQTFKLVYNDYDKS